MAPGVAVDSSAAAAPSAEPIAYINGKRVVLPAGKATQTLLSFLRETGLTGTKLGCGEGGCGACTVMVSVLDPITKAVSHKSVNACLAPLYSIEGTHVITVEGIGNKRDGLHPVQASLAQTHGSQCGFCTPGFVMSMYTLLRQKDGEAPTEEEIEDALGGNLCRCTGYRPILESFRVFAKTESAAYAPDTTAAATAVSAGKSLCPSTGKPCDCRAPAPEGKSSAPCGNTFSVKAAAEPIFPAELATRPPPALVLPGPDSTWHRPTSLADALRVKNTYNDAKVIIGNTEVGIEMNFKAMKYPILLSTTHVPEMNVFEVSEKGITIGSSVTLSQIMHEFKKIMQVKPEHETRTLKAVVEQLRWFAGNQIRNVSAVGGNICTASPISDLNPIWMATGTIFTTLAEGSEPRNIPAKDFFLAYRKVDLKANELLLSIFVPWTTEWEWVKEYKQAHRREDDIAIVNAGIRAEFEPAADGAGFIVKSASLAYGGMAAKSVNCPKVSEFLAGKPWTQATLEEALKLLKEDLPLAPTAPGGMIEFRSSLTASFLFKFFIHSSIKLAEKTPTFDHGLPASYLSAAKEYERPPAGGLQYYKIENDATAAGLPIMHQSAEIQVTGEAQYVDDVRIANLAHSALVTSTKPHAKILSIDTKPAEEAPGFLGIYMAKDVPGTNIVGGVVQDEELFITEEVTAVGQIIAIVVADTHEHAKAAARLVKVEYEELPALLSVEEAIAAESFIILPDHNLVDGDVDAGFTAAEVSTIIEGETRMGGQEQFYLETHGNVSIPIEHNEFVVIGSTQCPRDHQEWVCKVLNIPENRVVSKTKRLGGGFGGKEARSAPLQCASAVAAYHLRRPVKLILDRDVDMQVTGQRHPFYGKYKVAIDANGKILAWDSMLYANGGYSLDLSGGVFDRALFHSDNAYKLPVAKVDGRICKTNLPSNTAFRGFGGPQGMLVIEQAIDKIARALGKRPEEIREINFYKEGDTTHYGQVLEKNNLQGVWGQVKQNVDYDKVLAEVEEYNKAHRYRKRGVAIVPVKFGIAFTARFLNQAGALVNIYTDGTVLVSHGGTEMGQGIHTKMAQVAATVLGVPITDVFIAETSTDKVPNGSPSAASATADLNGGAVENACEQLVERLKPYRDQFPEASFAEIAHKAYMDRVDLSSHGFYRTPDINFDWTTKKGMPFNYYCYGAAFSLVELDTLTGDWQLLKTEIVHDVGNSLNPAIDVGQVEGAFVQGMGYYCLEELVFGDADHKWVRPGYLFTAGPGTYKIPSVNDIPIDFRVTLLQNAPNPRAVLSSKAVGEPPLFLGASVFFAIKDAIYAARKDEGLDGYFELDSPCTPERIRMACADKITAPYAPADLRPKISI